MKKKMAISIVAVLLILSIVVAVVLIKNSDNSNPIDSTTEAVAEKKPGNKPNGDKTYSFDEKYVSFKNSSGDVINKIDVENNLLTVPSKDKYEVQNQVFMGWGDKFNNAIVPESAESQTEGGSNATTTENGGKVNEDDELSLNPNFVDISNADNAFVLPAVYAETDENAKAQLKLCGKVNMCGFDIAVKYDAEKLSVSTIENIDGDIIKNIKNDEGKFYLNFSKSHNIDGEINIGNIVFENKTGGPVKVPVEIEIVEVVKFDTSGEIIEAKSRAVTSFVCFY